MFGRGCFKMLGLICLVLPFAGCSNTDVSSIQVSPSSQVLAVGQSAQFSASGYIGHGSHPPSYEDLTTQVTWTSSTPAVATVNSNGKATAVSAGSITITAAYHGATSGTATITVTGSSAAEPLVSMAIVPSAQTASAINQTAQFIAIGTTSNGTTVNLTNQSATVGGKTISPAVWSSSSTAIATVDAATGLATATGSGAATISAIAKNPDGTVVTGTATFTVTAPGSPEPLVSLAIVPASQSLTMAGQAANFVAIGTTSGGATVNLTNQPAKIGSVTIQAAKWSSSVPSVAAINSATGVATSAANGTTAITAVATNPDGTVVSGVATLTVDITSSPEPLVSLAIIPNTQTALAINQTAQFIAIGTTGAGTTKDLTTQANWKSSNKSVATVNPTTGLATAVGAGTTAITAIATNPDGTVVTGTAIFTVTVSGSPEPLVSLSIVPTSQTALAINQTAQFIAIGTTGSGTTVNLTDKSAWTSSDTGIATVNAQTGLATAKSAGTAAITAIASNPDGSVVEGTASFTVTIPASPEPLVSLAIIPGNQTLLAVGQTAQYYAIGTTGTGTTVNLTDTVTWSSTNVSVAKIDGNGLATGSGTGTTAITAMAANPDSTVVTGTAALTVTNPTWTSLAILPASQSAQSVGETAQFIAIGTTGAGLTEDLTSLATWSSSDKTVATVNATGMATASATGTTTISAEYKNPDKSVVAGSATFVVTIEATQEPLISLAIIPLSQEVETANESAQFIAIGTFSGAGAQAKSSICGGSGTIQDCTDKVKWSSSDTKIASISQSGLATALSTPGTAAITAIATNPDGTLVTGSASFTQTLLGSGPVQQATLTVALVGSGAKSGLVTAPAPQNPNGPLVINCSASNPEGCVQPFPLNSTVTLTAPAPPKGTQFGGWSSNCIPTAATINPTGPNSCNVVLGDNSTVAAIFY